MGLVVSGLVAQCKASRPSQSRTLGLAPLNSNSCISDNAPTYDARWRAVEPSIA